MLSSRSWPRIRFWNSQANEWGAYNGYRDQSSRGAGRSGQDYDPLHHAAWNDVSLERHLQEQLSFIRDIPPTVRRIIMFMIGNLDDKGYLGLSLDEIIGMLQAEPGQAELALKILQSFEPVGVGARDLRECLLLQVQSLPECSPVVSLLIDSHLKDVADYRIHKLSMLLQVSSTDIQAAIDVIKGLNPRPGAAFYTEEVHYVIPDVKIEQAGEQFAVRIHDAASPRLSVNAYYERMAKDSREPGEARKFLHSKLHSALFFMKCLEQRRLTIFRVAQAIVEEQTEFFWKGASYLKPMTLRQIADKLKCA